jgi:hypothetical protein
MLITIRYEIAMRINFMHTKLIVWLFHETAQNKIKNVGNDNI